MRLKVLSMRAQVTAPIQLNRSARGRGVERVQAPGLLGPVQHPFPTASVSVWLPSFLSPTLPSPAVLTLVSPTLPGIEGEFGSS